MTQAEWEKIDSDLTTPEFFAGEAFHQTFKVMRREDPVHWTRGNYERGFWSLTRFDDIMALLTDAVLFSQRQGTHMPPGAREVDDEQFYARGLDSAIPFMDPPKHKRVRQPFNKHFSVPAVQRLRGETEEIVDDLLREIGPRGQADLVEDVAAQLPVRLFLRMMGVPEQDWAWVRSRTLAVLHAQDKEVAGDRLPEDVIVEASAEVQAYMDDLARVRRTNSTDDFTSIIANMMVDGEYLSERIVASMSRVIVAGGLETTRNAVAVGFRELILRPQQARLLKIDPSIAKAATEEVLRWVTPSKNRMRVAMADTEIGGRKIDKGDWVVGWAVSGNRDESVFGETADEFDITRWPNPHMAFGDGDHICLGRNIARLEIQVLLQKFFSKIEDVRIVEEPDWIVSDNTAGFKKLQVEFTPTDAG
ncbi:MAG: cytochrome P450 [Mycetocola sp.]